MGLNFTMNMTWEGLIRLSLSKKRPKIQFLDTRGARYLWLSQCTVAPTAFWKCVFWGILYMWHVDRWNILHALSLKMARCFRSLFSRHISQTFHSQRFKIQQNHQTHCRNGIMHDPNASPRSNWNTYCLSHIWRCIPFAKYLQLQEFVVDLQKMLQLYTQIVT